MEKWKDVPGYEGFYKVSNMGRIKSTARIVKRVKGVNGSKFRTVKERILSQSDHDCGYKTVSLGRSGVSKTKYVHRLVAEAFLPNKKSLRTVNHKNGIKDDNRVDNIEWCSYSNNVKHAYKNGMAKISEENRIKSSIRMRGEKAPLAKLNKFKVIEIRQKYSSGGITQTELARIYKVSQNVISAVVNRHIWSHVKQPMDNETGELIEN